MHGSVIRGMHLDNPTVTIPQAFQLALQHHQAGRLTEAEGIYRQILAVVPHHADSLHQLGIIAHQVGSNDVAVEMILKAIAFMPTAWVFYSNLGEVYRNLNRLDEAIAAFRQAIHLKPDSADAIYNLGNALRDQGHLAEAVAAYRRSIELNPGAPEDRGDGKGEVFLAIDTEPNYMNTIKPAPGATATYTYCAIYRIGDQEFGQWSQPLEMTVRE